MVSAKAKAKLTFEVEFDISSGWGSDCTVSQVEKQAHDEAVRVGHKIVEAANGKWGDLKTHPEIRFLCTDKKIIIELGMGK